MYIRNGSLIVDKSRGIVYITYDFNNNPKQIYFDNGNVTKYVYSASGEKLRVVHYTAKPTPQDNLADFRQSLRWHKFCRVILRITFLEEVLS